MLIFSSSSTFSPQVEVNHRKPESLLCVLNLVRPLTELCCGKLNEELKEKQTAEKKEGE